MALVTFKPGKKMCAFGNSRFPTETAMVVVTATANSKFFWCQLKLSSKPVHGFWLHKF